jgi:hypothetical protein
VNREWVARGCEDEGLIGPWESTESLHTRNHVQQFHVVSSYARHASRLDRTTNPTQSRGAAQRQRRLGPPRAGAAASKANAS